MVSTVKKLNLARLPGRLLRLMKRRRRLFAAIFFCAAVAAGVNQLAPVSQSSQAVLSAARDLPAGKQLSAADLLVVGIPPPLAPSSALLRPEEAIGQQLAGAMRKGQLLADTSLVSQSLLAGAPPGSSAVPLRLADPATAQLVSPGQLVTVLGSADDGLGRNGPGTVLASAVPILWTQASRDAEPGWPSIKDSDGLVVVAASTEQAAALAGAAGRSRLSLLIVNPG